MGRERNQVQCHHRDATHDSNIARNRHQKRSNRNASACDQHAWEPCCLTKRLQTAFNANSSKVQHPWPKYHQTASYHVEVHNSHYVVGVTRWLKLQASASLAAARIRHGADITHCLQTVRVAQFPSIPRAPGHQWGSLDQNCRHQV